MSKKKTCIRNKCQTFEGCAMCAGHEEPAYRACAREAALRDKELYNHEHTKAYSK